jgi:hypothetical protein
MTNPQAAGDWTALLRDAVGALRPEPGDGRLGYLTATSKVENPVRDMLAFHMHQQLAAGGFVVAREYPAGNGQRHDICVLGPSGEPAAEVEIKALYGLNVVNRADRLRYLGYHDADAVRLRQSPAAGFLMSLVTHPMAVIPAHLMAAMKYAGYHNRAAAGCAGSAAELHERAQAWEGALQEHWPVAAAREFTLGEVYGVPFRLSCYLVGPLMKPS